MTPAESSRAWREENPAKVMHYQAWRRARLKGQPFDLTIADMEAILAASEWTCAYCTTPVGSFRGRGNRPQSATLDRLLPELGYVKGNVVIACHVCNSQKADHTPTSLRAWADLIDTVINRQNPQGNQ